MGKQKIRKSFYDWCYQNLSKEEANKIISRWDYEKNECNPKDISYGSEGINKKGYWFKCNRNIHSSELKSINNFTNTFIRDGNSKILNCDKCNSLGQWCIDNNRQDILNRWNYELNKCSPFDISYKSHGFNDKGYWLKCLKHPEHDSELKSIRYFIKNKNNKTIKCNKCESFAQYLIDTYGEDGIQQYWSSKNVLDPWKIFKSSRKKVWIICQEKSYHDNYSISCYNFTISNQRCPYCNGNSNKIHPKDSLGQYIIDNYGQEFLDKVWNSKNKKSSFEYTPMSSKKVWWCCPNGKHKEFKRSISDSNNCNFRCLQCVQERDESMIQEKVRLYLENNYNQYQILQRLSRKPTSLDVG